MISKGYKFLFISLFRTLFSPHTTNMYFGQYNSSNNLHKLNMIFLHSDSNLCHRFGILNLNIMRNFRCIVSIYFLKCSFAMYREHNFQSSRLVHSLDFHYILHILLSLGIANSLHCMSDKFQFFRLECSLLSYSNCSPTNKLRILQDEL